MADRVRNCLLVRACLEVLSDAERPLPPAEAVARVRDRVGEFSAYELGLIANSREVRWVNALGWYTGDMATVGWMTKTGGWQITDSGREALTRYDDPDELLRVLHRLRQQVYNERNRAAERLAPVER